MIAGYLAHPTWLHRVPAGVKLSLVAVASLAVLPVADPLALLAALGLTFLVYASLGRQAVSRLTLLRPLLPFLVLIGALQVWFESWPAAIASTTRILLMILVASLVTLTTTMQAMVGTLQPLMRPSAPRRNQSPCPCPRRRPRHPLRSGPPRVLAGAGGSLASPDRAPGLVQAHPGFRGRDPPHGRSDRGGSRCEGF